MLVLVNVVYSIRKEVKSKVSVAKIENTTTIDICNADVVGPDIAASAENGFTEASAL